MWSAPIGAFGGLIAYAVQSVGRLHGLDAWRWLSITEAAISIAICMLARFGLLATPKKLGF